MAQEFGLLVRQVAILADSVREDVDDPDTPRLLAAPLELIECFRVLFTIWVDHLAMLAFLVINRDPIVVRGPANVKLSTQELIII